MFWNTGKVQTNQSLSVARRVLSACLLACLVYGALGATTALAMSPPPPEPSQPAVPAIEIVPDAPNLSADISQTQVRLSWNATEHAEYYPVYSYASGQWQHLENVRSTSVTYNHQQRGWSLSELQIKILACKAKDWWMPVLFFWEWWGSDRCSGYSNTIWSQDYLPSVKPTFSLSAYSQTLATSSVSSSVSPSQVSDPVGAVRFILATLRLRNTTTYEYQDIPWPVYLDTNNFTVTSNKTLEVMPGTYDVEFLMTDGGVQYAAKALGVALNTNQQYVPLELKVVLGDTQLTIDKVAALPEFQFHYDPAAFNHFTQPKIGVKMGGGNETLLTLNPDKGIASQYLSLSAGQQQVVLTFQDGVLLKGRSRPAQESQIIIAGQPLEMNLDLLRGEVASTLNGNTATLDLAIPKQVIDEVGGNLANLQVLLSINGTGNNPFYEVLLTGLTYNQTSDTYQVQHSYTGIQADSQVTLSLTFTDVSAESDQFLGRCVADNFILDNTSRTVACELTLRRRAIVGDHLLAVLDINVSDSDNNPVSGSRVYANRQENGQDTQDTLLGLTGSSHFGSLGYLKAHLLPGDYRLKAHYAPLNAEAENISTVAAFTVTNENLLLNKPLTDNTPPTLTLTAPVSNDISRDSYTITWTATDPDNQANISLYYDTDNTGRNGILIVDTLVEGIHNSYTWNMSGLPADDYYVYARIDDGVNNPVWSDYSGKISFFPVKINDTGIDWGGIYASGNNSTCAGETISQQDCNHGRDAQARAGTLTKVGAGAAGFDFTRLNADGSDYTGSGIYDAEPWACVRDNYTGLTWEVKTDDGSIHDKDNTYKWGGKTTPNRGSWGNYFTDWDTLVDGSNANSGLCGFNDWRVPSREELDSIVNIGRYYPAIDTDYFPNTQSAWYWSSSPHTYQTSSYNYAWAFSFSKGHSYDVYRPGSYHVRLVRSAR